MSERARSWIRGAGDAFKKRFAAKERPPEIVDSIKGEKFDDFADRLEKMAKRSSVVGVYHLEERATIFTVPKGANCAEIDRMYVRQFHENSAMQDKLRREYEERGGPAYEEPPKPSEDMDNVVDIDELMYSLDTVDFKDVAKVLEWCISFVESRSPNEMAKIFKKKILTTFAEHGYTPGMNRGFQYKPVNAEDRDSAGGCVIGDMLAGIDTEDSFVQALFLSGIRREYDEWKAKFETKPAPEVGPVQGLRRLG